MLFWSEQTPAYAFLTYFLSWARYLKSVKQSMTLLQVPRNSILLPLTKASFRPVLLLRMLRNPRKTKEATFFDKIQ